MENKQLQRYINQQVNAQVAATLQERNNDDALGAAINQLGVAIGRLNPGDANQPNLQANLDGPVPMGEAEKAERLLESIKAHHAK